RHVSNRRRPGDRRAGQGPSLPPQLDIHAPARNEWVPEFVSGAWHLRRGEAEMIADSKRRSARDKADRDDGQRRMREQAAAEALENTFPASDPVAMEQPAPAS